MFNYANKTFESFNFYICWSYWLQLTIHIWWNKMLLTCYSLYYRNMFPCAKTYDETRCCSMLMVVAIWHWHNLLWGDMIFKHSYIKDHKKIQCIFGFFKFFFLIFLLIFYIYFYSTCVFSSFSSFGLSFFILASHSICIFSYYFILVFLLLVLPLLILLLFLQKHNKRKLK